MNKAGTEGDPFGVADDVAKDLGALALIPRMARWRSLLPQRSSGLAASPCLQLLASVLSRRS